MGKAKIFLKKDWFLVKRNNVLLKTDGNNVAKFWSLDKAKEALRSAEEAEVKGWKHIIGSFHFQNLWLGKNKFQKKTKIERRKNHGNN